MKIRNNQKLLEGSKNRKILLDFYSDIDTDVNKVIILSHGFKGFKDWGCFNLMSEYFAKNGITFVKFNFSHNGTSSSSPQDFVDLKSFGNNNYSKELYDLDVVVNWVEKEFDGCEIYLIGHSRGGSISLIKSIMDNRIKKIITWAAPSDIIDRFPIEKINEWKDKGEIYIYNSRTKQKMPLYIQFYNDIIFNKDNFNIKERIKLLKIPFLIIHGDNDKSVELYEAKNLNKWNSESEIHIINGANHVFGGYHPYDLEFLPKDFNEVINKTIDFINQ